MTKHCCNHWLVLMTCFCFALTNFSISWAAPLLVDDICTSSGPVAQKFFTIGQLVFLSDNADQFATYRIYNHSSGAITNRYGINDLIPSRLSNGESLQWAYMFDLSPKQLTSYCSISSQYCDRLVSLQGIIVVQISNQALLFMRFQPNSSNPLVVLGQDVFIEMQALLKHLDHFGYTSSLAFDNAKGHFVSTHYGLMAQICVTTTRYQDKGKMSYSTLY